MEMIDTIINKFEFVFQSYCIFVKKNLDLNLFYVLVILRASSHELSADLSGVQVIIHKTINNARKLGSNKEVAGAFKSWDDCSKSCTNLNEEM